MPLSASIAPFGIETNRKRWLFLRVQLASIAPFGIETHVISFISNPHY